MFRDIFESIIGEDNNAKTNHPQKRDENKMNAQNVNELNWSEYNEEQKKLAALEIGEEFVLNNVDDGTTYVCALRDGGLSGGADYDIYAAFIGWENEIDGAEELPRISISQAEAAEIEIAL